MTHVFTIDRNNRIEAAFIGPDGTASHYNEAARNGSLIDFVRTIGYLHPDILEDAGYRPRRVCPQCEGPLFLTNERGARWTCRSCVLLLVPMEAESQEEGEHR